MLVGKQIMTESKKSDSLNPFSKVFDPAVEFYSRGLITGFASFWFGKNDAKLINSKFRREIENISTIFFCFNFF